MKKTGKIIAIGALITAGIINNCRGADLLNDAKTLLTLKAVEAMEVTDGVISSATDEDMKTDEIALLAMRLAIKNRSTKPEVARKVTLAWVRDKPLRKSIMLADYELKKLGSEVAAGREITAAQRSTAAEFAAAATRARKTRLELWAATLKLAQTLTK